MIAARAQCALGERVPARIVEPADAAELAAELARAANNGESVVAIGGATLQAAANPPLRYDVALRTRQLDALHAYDPRDLTAGAGAGITLSALSRALSEHRQMLPFDAPLPRDATLGGTLAAGWAGPRRASYGRPRDLVIGATAALADGTLASSGGMVVKNVTGYDMAKLYIGSHGTLGVLTRINVKVLPAPAARSFATSAFDDDVRTRLVGNLAALSTPPTALLLLDTDALSSDGTRTTAPSAVALFEGSEATVARALREYRSALGAAGVAETRIDDGDAAGTAYQAIVDRYVAAPPISFTLLFRGLPSEAASRAARARATMARCTAEAAAAARGWETITDLLTGDVAARFICDGPTAVDDAIAVSTALRVALGTATLLAASDALIGRIDAWGTTPSTIAAMRALKARFDPTATLAPGRYVGGI